MGVARADRRRARSRCARSPRPTTTGPEIAEAAGCRSEPPEQTLAELTRRAPPDRRDLADRVGARHRDARAPDARRRRWPRTSPRTRSSTALERWPRDGIPPNPGAWLTATAKHRAIDLMRRNSTLQDKYALLARSSTGEGADADLDAEVDDDDRRRPAEPDVHVLPPGAPTEARVALTLRMLGGLTTPEIARGVPRARADRRPADLAREADARRGGRAVRGAGRRRARGAAGVRARGRLPRCSTRATPRRGRRLDAPGADGGGAAARARARRPAPGRARGPRAGGADGAPGVAAGGAGRAATARRCCSPTRTAAAGTGC